MPNTKPTHTGLIRQYKSLAISYIAQAKGYEWCPHIFGGTEHYEKDGKCFHGPHIVTLDELKFFANLIDQEIKPEEAAKKTLEAEGLTRCK